MHPRRTRSPWLTVAGALLLAVAGLVSNTSLEQAFGRAPHSLAWGPALFRILLVIHGLALIVAGFRSEQRPATPLWAPLGKRTVILLAALTAVAVALRLPGLNSCMWLDEVLTMVRFARPPVGQILTSF